MEEEDSMPLYKHNIRAVYCIKIYWMSAYGFVMPSLNGTNHGLGFFL